MDSAPLEEEASRVGLPASTISADPAVALAALDADGLLRIDGALSASSAASLISHVNASLVEALGRVRDGEVEDGAIFGPVLCRVNRYDLKLALSAPVKEALDELRTGWRDL